MARLKEIENELGRVRNHRRPARLTIDIDMLVFDREILEGRPLEPGLPGRARRRVAARPVLPVDGRVAVARGHSPRRRLRRSGRRPEILAGSHRTGTSRTKPTSSTRTRTP